MNADDLVQLLDESVSGVAPATPPLALLRAEGRRRLVRRRVAAAVGTAAVAVASFGVVTLALPGGNDAVLTPVAPTVSTTPVPTVAPSLAPLSMARLAQGWSRHGEGLTINADGTGLWTFRTYRQCTTPLHVACENTTNGQFLIYPAHVRFVLDSTDASGDSGTGRVLSTDDPSGVPFGPVSVSLATGGGLVLTAPPGTIDGIGVQTFCDAATTDRSACGA